MRHTATTQVAVVKTNTDYSEVAEAVRQAVELIGGLEGIVSAGQKVLLKPNLLEIRSSEQGATTDRRIVGALIDLVKEQGALPIVGDASGMRYHGATERVLRGTGMRAHCEELGAEVVSFDAVKPVKKTIPNARVMQNCYFADTVLHSDVIVSIPKLKTHSLTKFTGAVKNLLGTLPGGQKTIAHRLGSDAEKFAEVLVDIYAFLKPQLAVMDAVVGLGGLWRESDRVEPGLIIAGRDAVAVDAVAARIVGFNPTDIPTLRLAAARGLGTIDRSSIRILGEPLKNLAVKRMTPGKIQTALTGLFFKLFAGVTSKEAPKVNAGKCNACQHCQVVCPVEAISFGPKNGDALSGGKTPQFDLDKCIRCFCCHELCAQRAIEVDKGFWGNLYFGKP